MGLGADAFTSSADRADCRRRAHREDHPGAQRRLTPLRDRRVGKAKRAHPATFGCALRALTLVAACLTTPCDRAVASEATIVPADLPRIATIDPRFQSFNIEMVEVTGGPFWKPYAAADVSADRK